MKGKKVVEKNEGDTTKDQLKKDLKQFCQNHRVLQKGEPKKKRAKHVKPTKEDLDNFYLNKKFAKDCFNEKLTDTHYQRLLPAFTPPSECTISFFESIPRTIFIDNITFVSNVTMQKNTSEEEFSLLKVLQFYECVKYIKNWQNDWLQKLGWTCNTTGYDIINVSMSSAELMESAIEWLHMQAKLSTLMLQYQKDHQ
jgi:hypothetical protein